MRDSKWVARVGVEIHAQLRLRSKLFSGAESDTRGACGAMKNGRVAAFDAALPGTLPRLNAEAVKQAVAVAHALRSEVHALSRFERKHYYYGDLPHGFQITQRDQPIATGGRLRFARLDQRQGEGAAGGGTPRLVEGSVGVDRLQLEVDSGTSAHGGGDSQINLDRAGAALLELVLEPTLRSGLEASSAVRELQATLRWIGASDGKLEDGSLRADVNVSVERAGAAAGAAAGAYGTPVEVKNLNSFSQIARAVDFEAARQARVLEQGGAVERETRTWDDGRQETLCLRRKGGAVDYRYFPEPDLPDLVLPEVLRRSCERGESPADVRRRWSEAFGFASAGGTLPDESVHAMLSAPKALNAHELFDLLVAGADGVAPRSAAQWVEHDLLAPLREHWGAAGSGGGSFGARVPAGDALRRLWALRSGGDISVDCCRELSAELAALACAQQEEELDWGQTALPDPEALVEERGLRRIRSEEQLRDFCRGALDDPANAKALRQLLGGKDKLRRMFFGKAMVASGKRADAQALQRVLDEEIEARRGGGAPEA